MKPEIVKPEKVELEMVTGKFIRAVRKRFRLTQGQFAKELGLHLWQIYRMEKYGKKIPRVHLSTRIVLLKGLFDLMKKYKNLKN